MMKFNSLMWRLGALSAGTSIAIQAYGGHKPWTLEKKMLFSKAWEIQFSSAAGMMILSNAHGKSKIRLLGGWGLFFGSLIFSGILYYRCFSDDKSLNYLMPYGGGSVMLGWLLLASL
jgi:uncharacterized membrane protein YgdD (TMEM256/DUF423 family)